RQLRPVVEGPPSRAMVREAEYLRTMEVSLEGAVVAIDPGHGPDDPGDVGPSGLAEAEVTLKLARDLSSLLEALGAKPMLLRETDDDPTASDRARTANELGAALCLSLHLNGGDTTGEGATCFFF